MQNIPSHLILIAPSKAAPRRFARALATLGRHIEVLWRALAAGARRKPKSLLIRETSALGDRRLVAVVQFERQRFLIGCSPSSVTLLARLPDANPASEAAGAATPTNGGNP